VPNLKVDTNIWWVVTEQRKPKTTVSVPYEGPERRPMQEGNRGKLLKSLRLFSEKQTKGKRHITITSSQGTINLDAMNNSEENNQTASKKPRVSYDARDPQCNGGRKKGGGRHALHYRRVKRSR